MKIWKSAFLSALLVLLLAFLQSSLNFAAAAELTKSSPAAGVSLNSSPSVVTVTFSAVIGDIGNLLTVTAPNGDRVDDGSIQIADGQMLVGLKPLTLAGEYLVEYEIVTIEGEDLIGQYKFTYVAPDVLATPSPESEKSVANGLNKETNSSKVTDFFMIGLLVLSILVLILISRSLRKPKKKKRKK